MPSGSDSDGIRSSSPTLSERPRRRNILLVGDVGVGKSSLINLIAGKDIATTSSGVKSCTLESREYIVTLDGVEFALHDTAGLHEAQEKMKASECLDAVHQAYALISKLERSGGISLLVFCMKAGRISVTTQQTYNLFADVLCNRQVPVVAVLTHSEMIENTEEWWRRNKGDLKRYGIRSLGHACITATRGYEGVYSDKYDKSQVVIRELLLDLSDRISWKENKASWIKRMVVHIRSILPHNRRKDLDGSDLKKKLVKKCGFSIDDANLVSQKIRESQRGLPEEQLWFDEQPADDGGSYVSLPVARSISPSAKFSINSDHDSVDGQGAFPPPLSIPPAYTPMSPSRSTGTLSDSPSESPSGPSIQSLAWDRSGKPVRRMNVLERSRLPTAPTRESTWESGYALPDVQLLPTNRTIGVEMPLAQFCTTYNLSARILSKLEEDAFENVTHLRFVTISQLEEMGLKRGEIAALRNAIEEWSVAT